MNLLKLQEPFREDEVEWRIMQSGFSDGKPWAKVICYIQSRAIMDRLDEVCDPESWRDEYREWHEGSGQSSQLCGISIKCGDEWIIKWDGAENTDIEGVKGGLSNAFKRAAVKWGMGRYLYNITGTHWAIFTNMGINSVKIENNWYKWNPPKMPKEFLPKDDKGSAKKEAPKNKPPAESNKPPDPIINPMTENQRKTIFGKMKDFGITDADCMKMTLGNMIGKEIASRNEICRNDATKIIKILNDPEAMKEFVRDVLEDVKPPEDDELPF